MLKLARWTGNETPAHAVLSRRFTCLKVVIPVEGSAVLVAKFALYLSAAGAEGNEETAGKGVARPGSDAILVIVAFGPRG
jgi:hypothetical protein